MEPEYFQTVNQKTGLRPCMFTVGTALLKLIAIAMRLKLIHSYYCLNSKVKDSIVSNKIISIILLFFRSFIYEFQGKMSIREGLIYQSQLR